MTADLPRPASTVVVVRAVSPDRPPEIFMVQRHRGTAFMGGAHVFPGGTVDAADLALPRAVPCDGVDHAVDRLPAERPEAAIGYFVAALRELFEEAGILLAREPDGRLCDSGADGRRWHDARAALSGRTASFAEFLSRHRLRLALDAVEPFAHWVTPASEPRRFDARFFAAVGPPAQTARHDDLETVAGVWMTAREALARFAHGEIVLPPPTQKTLEALADVASADGIISFARSRTLQRIEPQLVVDRGRRLLVLPGDEMYRGGAAPSLEGTTRFVLTNGRWVAARGRSPGAE